MLIKPILALHEKPGQPPENPENAESVWLETMRIPAGFSGLTTTPAPVAAVSPNAPSASEIDWLLGATWKSNFEPGDKPTLQILRDCSDPAVSDCDARLPQDGPSLINYIFQNGPRSEDMVPESKDSFEIGTVALGSQVEAAFHINPGFVPGRYTVNLFTKDRKLTATFEVVAATTPAGAAATQPATQPTTQPAEPSIRSYIAPSKSPVPK
ncbi:MAG TPA: hypothetical protein VFX30_05405 [bacterium]|nr:hypothetical protein [bacterium]